MNTTRANNPTKIGTGTYKYNAADELETGPSLTYAYNEVAERTKMTPSTGPTTTYGYDQAGNLTSIERPKEGETPKIEDTYAYNGESLRSSQAISGTTSYFAWDMTEDLPLILSDGTNSYIYGPGDLPVEQISNGGTITYLHHDQQGSTRLLTGSTGKAEATFTYGPYGALTGSTGTATTPLGYDGQYTNSDTGLIYLRARTYDPATAQFLSGDPLVALTGKPYAYAEDNPLNGGDPSGLCNANPFTGSFWSEGNCLSGAVGGPNGGGSQPGWWAIPAYGAIAAPCLFGGELACAGAAGAGTVPGLAGSTASMGCSTVGAVTPNFSDPSQPPGPGWEWRGNGPVGSSEGAWYNPSTNQSLHPDLEHAAPKGSHYDYKGPDTGGRQVPLYPGDPVPEPSVPALGPIEEP